MIRILCAATLAAAILTAPAPAQSPAGSTRAFVEFCVRDLADAMSEPEPNCACAAGFLAGRMSERDFRILGRIAPFLADAATLQREVESMVRYEGYDAAEIVAVGEFLQTSGDDIDAVCALLQR